MPWRVVRHSAPLSRKLKDKALVSNTDSTLPGQSELDVLDTTTEHSDEQDPLLDPIMAPNIRENPSADEHAEEVIKETPTRKWQSYIWDSLDKSPQERNFLFKLDSAVLTFASLGYFIKYLDQSNINSG